MRHLRGLTCFFAALLFLNTAVFAADYNFETPAPHDYYGSTSYEEVYGAQYNYGGINAVDFLDPLAESSPFSVATSSSALEYGINAGSGSIFSTSTDSAYPVQWEDLPASPTSQITAVSDVLRSDGSIGTLTIPSLGICYKVYDGTDTDTMRKGLGHFPSTSAWSGLIGICGHNRGSNHNIGGIKDLDAGDIIRYETILGTRTYEVAFVKIIDWTDWSYLGSTADNRITIITCLADQPTKRVCVQGVEVSS